MGIIHLVRTQNLPNECVSDGKKRQFFGKKNVTHVLNDDPMGKLLLSLVFF